MNKLYHFLFVFYFPAAILVPEITASGQQSMAFNPNSGYINITEFIPAIGLAATQAAYSKYFFGITNINGYQISFKDNMTNKKLQTGLGAGVFFYNEGTLFPLFLDFRFIWEINNIAPYVFADGGGLLSFKDFNQYSRLFADPGLGVRYTVAESLAVNLGIGLHVQSRNETHAHDSFINLKLGLVFKPK
ncbi:MAG: hypothetical protein JXB19_04405 [Bacteroidales bacterium]|nr:hypothetical protein [Bacteroidales bacterium]